MSSGNSPKLIEVTVLGSELNWNDAVWPDDRITVCDMQLSAARTKEEGGRNMIEAAFFPEVERFGSLRLRGQYHSILGGNSTETSAWAASTFTGRP
jgi:hypothetical protein